VDGGLAQRLADAEPGDLTVAQTILDQAAQPRHLLDERRVAPAGLRLGVIR